MQQGQPLLKDSVKLQQAADDQAYRPAQDRVTLVPAATAAAAASAQRAAATVPEAVPA
ncbi:hypothetical protein [Azohydromonas caseinilytica]|uniref:Uncharacterized protein n=1 Tax=Azohydromonas caseinilytica TaxID=2728836 RepID=A0A848FHQ6_9BURK|nr:hypothetical protein [Azohydromonas caseinilytica]NML17793.1 hypothetical protein [Azohydromonas caseinilytica]